MKKTVIILALALGFSISNVNATNTILTSGVEVIKPVEVSPLCKAVATGDMVAVKKLIKSGANVNEKSNGMMPIHYAAKYNRVDMIKVLITAGSKIHEVCDKGFTPLRHAEKSKAKDAALFLKRFKKKTV